MNYYIDIKLITDTEITLGFLWKKLYAQIHLALVEVRDKNNMVSVGVSFPNYSKDRLLGETLRLFAPSKEELKRLNLNLWLARLLDYISVSEIQEVPKDVKFVIFGRKQFKSNSEIRRLAKRYATRANVSYEEALKGFEKTEKKYKKQKNGNRLPYVNIESLSTGNYMKIFIIKKSSDIENRGLFSTYGLSNSSTVPWF